MASTSDQHMRICEVTVDSALGRLQEAMAASALWNGDVALRTDEFTDYRALATTAPAPAPAWTVTGSSAITAPSATVTKGKRTNM